MSNFDTDVMEDLFYDEAEGPARPYDEFEGFDASDEFEDTEGFDEFGGSGRSNAFDEGEDWAEDDYDAYDDADSDEALDAMEEAVADALAAEDSDEFLRRLRRGIGRAVQVARRVAPVVGRIARTVAPIASAIPLPWTQAVGRVAGVVGRLMADEADEFEAMDEMFDLAEDNIDAAAPVIAGLTIRRAIPGIARMPRATRRNLVRSVTQATRSVARRQGAQASRVMPGVVRRVQTAVRQRRIPPRAAPQAIQRLAARMARNPAVARRGATRSPSPVSRPTARRRQTYTLRGPVTITIRGR